MGITKASKKKVSKKKVSKPKIKFKTREEARAAAYRGKL